MKINSAIAIAKIVEEDGINEDYIIPNPFDKRVVNRVANEVEKLIKT